MNGLKVCVCVCVHPISTLTDAPVYWRNNIFFPNTHIFTWQCRIFCFVYVQFVAHIRLKILLHHFRIFASGRLGTIRTHTPTNFIAVYYLYKNSNSAFYFFFHRERHTFSEVVCIRRKARARDSTWGASIVWATLKRVSPACGMNTPHFFSYLNYVLKIYVRYGIESILFKKLKLTLRSSGEHLCRYTLEMNKLNARNLVAINPKLACIILKEWF